MKKENVERIRKREMAFIIFLLVIDQGSKAIAEATLLSSPKVLIPNFFELHYVVNTGAAWSILENGTIFLILFSLVVLFLLVMMYPSIPKGKLKSFAFSLLCGGIIGNLLDRMLFSYVKDFLKFTFFGYDFPIFNFADVFIVVGAFLLMILVWRDSNDKNLEVSKGRKRKTR